MGGITLTAVAPGITQGSSIHISISKPLANGPLGIAGDLTVGNTRTFTYPHGMVLKVRETNGASGTGYISLSSWMIVGSLNPDTGTLAQILIAVPSGLSVTSMDQISLEGDRVDISDMSVGSYVQAGMSTVPSQSNTFNPSNTVVANVQPDFSLPNITSASLPACGGEVDPLPSVTIQEGFPGAFVQYNPAPALNPRPAYGATANTQVRLEVNSLPSGITLQWPDNVVAGVSNAGQLVKINQTASGNQVLYEFRTENQGLSDMNMEQFAVAPSVVVSSGSPAGTASLRARLEPLTDSGYIPRFASYWTQETEFLTKGGCVDNLAPTLLIASPSDGANFSNFRITINGTATDSGTGNGGIVSVFVNGARAENDTATGNETALWSRSLNWRMDAN